MANVGKIERLGTRIYEILRRTSRQGVSGEHLFPPPILGRNHLPYLAEHLTPEELSRIQGQIGSSFKDAIKALSEQPPVGRRNPFSNPSLSNRGLSEGDLKALINKVGRFSPEANSDAFLYLSRLPGDIGQQFDAHGISKDALSAQLKRLNDFLSGRYELKSLHTAPLVGKSGLGAGLGATNAYRDGSFILVSGKGRSIAANGIEHVIVNDAYYNIIDALRSKFPHIGFVRADEAVEYFKNLL